MEEGKQGGRKERVGVSIVLRHSRVCHQSFCTEGEGNESRHGSRGRRVDARQHARADNCEWDA